MYRVVLFCFENKTLLKRVEMVDCLDCPRKIIIESNGYLEVQHFLGLRKVFFI